jgi:hypothetical protein
MFAILLICFLCFILLGTRLFGLIVRLLCVSHLWFWAVGCWILSHMIWNGCLTHGRLVSALRGMYRSAWFVFLLLFLLSIWLIMAHRYSWRVFVGACALLCCGIGPLIPQQDGSWNETDGRTFYRSYVPIYCKHNQSITFENKKIIIILLNSPLWTSILCLQKRDMLSLVF